MVTKSNGGQSKFFQNRSEDSKSLHVYSITCSVRNKETRLRYSIYLSEFKTVVITIYKKDFYVFHMIQSHRYDSFSYELIKEYCTQCRVKTIYRILSRVSWLVALFF